MKHGFLSNPSKAKALAFPLLLGLLCGQVYASDLPGFAHPPYRIKPNTPTAYASGLSPAQMKKAYGLSGITAQGEGQVIAVVDAYDNPNAEADLNVFSQRFSLPACTTANGCFRKIYASGKKPAGNPGWGVEIALDIQWSHAIAPKSKILLVEAASNSVTDLMNGVKSAIKNGATVVTMSWGGSEYSGQASADKVFNVADVTFTASSGDDGHDVSYPASSPYVIAVGGTSLHLDAAGNYKSETAWSGSGGGISAYEKETAGQMYLQIPNNPRNLRGVPDVAYNADPNTGVSVYDTYGEGGWMVIGGTSAGAPQWAGVIAVAKSAATHPLTDIPTKLYMIAKQNYATAYHDITKGSNGSCGYYCKARAGYDYVTGIGSPKADALIPALIK